MLEVIITVGLLCVLCFIGYKVTGALFTGLVWLFIKLPLAIFFFCLGLVLCCTILLIPAGKGCFKIAGNLLSP